MPTATVRKLALDGADTPETSRARTILKHAHESVQGFVDSFTDVRAHRGAGAGATTDEEQDLLRAALVFAAAGLDSVLKQLIRDAVPRLAQLDPSVEEGLETFVKRQLRGELDTGEAVSGQKFLARILIAASHRDELIEQYVLSLTGTSLQSADEVIRAATALGLASQELGIEKNQLRPIFGIRNEIIHELDINLSAPNRNRESRARAQMVRHSNVMLEIGERFVKSVEEKLTNA